PSSPPARSLSPLKRCDTLAVSAVLALAERGQVDVPRGRHRTFRRHEQGGIPTESLSRSPDLLRLVDRTKNERRNRFMIGQTESTRLRDRVLARVAGLLALLAVLGCFAPAAPALTPTPSGQFVSDTGSGEEAAQRSRFNDGQRGLQL